MVVYKLELEQPSKLQTMNKLERDGEFSNGLGLYSMVFKVDKDAYKP